MENEVKEPAPKYNYISPEQYLEMERADERRNEYYDGYVQAMSGASMAHNRIDMNLLTELGNFLKGKKCKALPSHMRVSTPAHDTYMYPDALIVCDEPQLEDDKFDTLLNPSVIFEILSPSTQQIDKGRKFFFYQQIPSLKEYIMIDSKKRFIYIARKQNNDSWKLETLPEAASILHIQTIDFQLSLDELYYDTGL